ncbi:MAG TPA: glycosyltransferase [Acidimicrobiia bacterium]|nr:glycosyltransferase [Acidimicrobiia bacterium]
MIDSLNVSGGAESQLATNLSLFDHNHMEHRVAVTKRTVPNREREISRHARIHHLTDEGENLGRLRLTARLRRLVEEIEPTLVHASLSNSGLATRLLARGGRQVAAVESLVNISHEPIRAVDNPNVTTSKLRLHAAVDRLTMPYLSGYHALSQAVADSWSRTIGLDPSLMTVIPRGVNLSRTDLGPSRVEARYSVLEEFGLPDDVFLVLSVGRVEPQKGHRYLIEAMSRLLPEHPQVRLVIAGRPGNASPLVESAIERHQLDSIVHLAGPRRDIHRLLAAADVFAFPSLFEGFGNALIEAMAVGLPVVTTREPPMTDLISDDSVGIGVDRADSEGLARAIERLVADRGLRERLGAAARARAATLPSSKDVAAAHESWYERLLAG